MSNEQNGNVGGRMGQPTAGNQPLPPPGWSAGQPPFVPPHLGQQQPPPPPRRSRTGLWILGVLLALSVIVNLLLMLLLVAVMGLSGSADTGMPLMEVVIEDAETENRVALLTIDGIITEAPAGRATAVGADYEYVALQVKRIIEDKNVKAVVICVNSPGGGASASDMMLKELQRLKLEREIPVVVQMGSLAASGGYYVAMAGERVFAQPTTLTGSIGVIAQFFSLKTLLQEKLGVETYIIESGKNKSMGTPFRDMTQDEKDYMLASIVMPMYERFLDVVKNGRPGVPEDRLRELADGRVLNAQQALEAGLIDQIGYEKEAIAYVMELAHLKRAKVVQYERRLGLLDVLGLAGGQVSPEMHLSPEGVQRMARPQVLMQWCP